MQEFVKNKRTSMETGQWTQNYPYNAQYARDTHMGCVAIALGNIIFHHKHPEHGYGILDEYRDHPAVVLDNFIYDWSNIPQRLTNNSTSNEIYMTSNLVMHISRACDIDAYGSYATTLNKGIKALTEKFDYDITFTKVDLLDEELCYTNEDILNIAKEELINGRPFYVEIFGHAIMCNGFKDNLFSFNWGWGGDDSWKTLDYLGVDPLNLGIGIKPKENESITCQDYHVDFTGNYSGDKGQVKIQVQSLNTGCDAIFRVVLHDAAGVKRNIISEEFKYSTLTHGMGIFSFTLPSTMTLGDRDICVEYKTTKSSYRPLRNKNNEKESFRFEAKRNNSTTSLMKVVGWPSVLKTNDSFDVSIVIKKGTTEGKIMALALADNNLNIIHVLGFCDYENEEGDVIEKTITCSLCDVRPEKKYKVIAITSNTDNFNSSSPLVNAYSSLPQSVYVQNKVFDMAKNIEQVSISGLDFSEEFLSDTYYPYQVQFKIIEPLSKPYPLYIVITDLNDNIVFSGISAIIDKGNLTIETSLPRLSADEHDSPRRLNIYHCISSTNELGHVTYLRIPESDNMTQNPFTISVTHLNYYSQLFLTDSPSTTKKEFKKGEVFQISTSVMYDKNGGSINLMPASLIAVAKKNNGEKITIGKTINLAFFPNVITPVNISCIFPEESIGGLYDVYIQVGSGIHNSTIPEQIFGYDHEVNTILHLNFE